MSSAFEPRIDSHFNLSALATDIVDQRLEVMMFKTEPKYEVKIEIGTPTRFVIEIYKHKSVLIEHTKKMSKIVHETVASLLGVDTDVKLRSIGVKTSDGNLSPDFISRDKKLVVELTTTTNTSTKNVEERFMQKIRHYKDALEGTGYRTGVVVVGETFVYTNLAMSQSMVDALCQRCRIGIAIKSHIERFLGVSLNADDRSQDEMIVERVLKSMSGLPAGDKFFPVSEILKSTEKPTQKEFKIASQIMKRELKESKTRSSDNKDMLMDYISSYTGNSRCDLKRITNIALIEPTRSTQANSNILSERDINQSDMPSWLKKIWKSSLSVKFKEEPLSTIKVEAMMSQGFDQHKVQKECAFNVTLTPDELEEASTTGLWGKSQKSTMLYQKNKKKNKMSFHPLETNTDDIERFVKQVNLLKPNTFCSISENVLTLLRDAKSVWKEDVSSSELLLRLLGMTRICGASSLITDLFTEICYCYKYWIGRADFYVKKCRGVYLLIRCTGTHIFVAFAYPKSHYKSFDTGRIGPTLFESDDFLFTDISSFTEPVVEHFVKSGPYIMSLLMHLMCSMELEITTDIHKSKALSADINGVFLLFLNNKTDAEEVMTNQRFLTMSVLEDLDPNPYRFVERLPGFIKSRLTVYLLKRTFALMEKYKEPPLRVLTKENDIPTMEYDGLVGFFNNEPITFKRKIEEFYYGYVISKEKGRGGDRNFKIMSKIVQQEYKFRDDNFDPFSYGLDTKTNQTNIPLMKVLCYIMKTRMKENYGDAWDDVLQKKVIERLSKITFLETATLKVSSRTYDEELKLPEINSLMTTAEIKDKLVSLNPDDVASRPRVMESLSLLLEEYKKETESDDVEHLIQLFPWCLKKIEDRGFFYSDIFPKAQHGGDREIHVLEIKARICQLVVETMSRSLCDMVPSDTLIHPGWKGGFIPTHYKNADAELDAHRITLGKSADASKWCQRNHASKFGVVLANFLPKWMAHPVLRVLSLWTSKVICFPIQFVANFLSNQNVKSNPIYERMRKEFLTGTGIFKQHCSSRMTIISGMMQGILHYTSSFTHGIIQEAMVECQKKLLNSLGIKSVISIAQGSDDSAEMLSLSGKSSKTLVRVGVTMLHWKEKVSRHIAIYTSRAKSCIGSIDMCEYNSEWYVRKQPVMPTFRWVSACLEVGVVEKFIDRIHNFYNTAANVIEAGGKILETATIQLCQAWMHYHMLGITSHQLSTEATNLLMELKDPSLGYFPLDSDYNAGITGVDFMLYKYHKDSEYGYGVGANKLIHGEVEMFSEDVKDPTVSQNLRKIRLKFGNHKIFSGLLRRLSAPELEDLLVEVENNPRLLYYPAHSWSESKVRVFMKLFEPGVKESLSKHSATARILSASAYMLGRPCLTWSGSTEKVSLYAALKLEKLHRFKGKSEKVPTNEVFLFHEEYEDTLNDITNLINHSVIQKVKYRSRSKQVIQVFDRMVNDVPILELCKEQWFGSSNTQLSRRQFQIKWQSAQERFKFLKDSREETKEALGMSEIQLKNFLVSIDSRPRRITLMDTSAKGSSVKSTMTRIFWPNVKLLTPGLNYEDEETASSLRSKIFSILSHWESGPEKTKEIMDLLSRSKILRNKNVPHKLLKLKCIFDAVTQASKEEIMNSIINNKIGNVGIFTIRQSGWGKERKGFGEWKGCVLSSDVKIHFMDDTCTKIYLSNLKERASLGRALTDILRSFQIRFNNNNQSSDHWLTSDGVINGGHGVMSAIPIEIDSDLKTTIFDDALEWEWFTDIQKNKIRLRAKMDNGMYITLITDTFKSYEWDPIFRMENSKFDFWNNSEPMQLEDLSNELSRFFNGSNASINKQLENINRANKESLSASGWQLSHFRMVLKEFFQLRFSPPHSPQQPSVDKLPTNIFISDEDLWKFQTGDFEVGDDVIAEFMQEDIGEEEATFDVDVDISGYIDENIEIIMAEREIQSLQNLDTMPASNRCLSSLELLCKAISSKSLREVYQECSIDPYKKYTGILGKIMTLVTGTPRMKNIVSELERSILSQEEDSVSATQSLKTEQDLMLMDEESIKSTIKEMDDMLAHVKSTGLRESILTSRARYVRVLKLLNVRDTDDSISKVKSRDFFLYFKNKLPSRVLGHNFMSRLSDGVFVLTISDKLDNTIDEMLSRSEIGEYELGLYREAITKPYLSTLLLDVFSYYLKTGITCGPYSTKDVFEENITVKLADLS